MEVASQHCDTVPNKTKDILDFRLKKKKLHDSRAQLPVQSRVDQNIKKVFGIPFSCCIYMLKVPIFRFPKMGLCVPKSKN